MKPIKGQTSFLDDGPAPPREPDVLGDLVRRHSLMRQVVRIAIGMIDDDRAVSARAVLRKAMEDDDKAANGG